MKNLITVLTTALFLVPAIAWSAPKIKIELKAEIELHEIVNGEEIIRFIPSSAVEPGQIIRYTLTYRNSSSQTANNVKLKDPVPEGTSYLPDSLFGEKADVSFSIDGGKSFKKPDLLFSASKSPDGTVRKIPAPPENYTDIQWLLKSVPAGSAGSVGFKVRVK